MEPCVSLSAFRVGLSLNDRPAGTRPGLGGTRPNSPYFAATTAGKAESIMADLQAPEGKALLHELLATADVIVENYRPGVMVAVGEPIILEVLIFI